MYYYNTPKARCRGVFLVDTDYNWSSLQMKDRTTSQHNNSNSHDILLHIILYNQTMTIYHETSSNLYT